MMTTKELADILLSYPEGTEVVTADNEGVTGEPLICTVNGKVLVY